jgi:hypothetical protein
VLSKLHSLGIAFLLCSKRSTPRPSPICPIVRTRASQRRHAHPESFPIAAQLPLPLTLRHCHIACQISLCHSMVPVALLTVENWSEECCCSAPTASTSRASDVSVRKVTRTCNQALGVQSGETVHILPRAVQCRILSVNILYVDPFQALWCLMIYQDGRVCPCGKEGRYCAEMRREPRA